MTKTLNTDDVRQGETGHGVRYVLFVSFSAATLALGAVLLYFA